MNILTIIQKAQQAASEYAQTPADQRTDIEVATRNGYAQTVADWRGFGLTDVGFRQFELVFGLEAKRLGL